MSISADELHRQLLDRVARLRTSEEWLRAMVAAARFHEYSLSNWLLLWSQAEARATAVTRPAGYRTWQTLGRQVRKGESGYRILAPVTRRVGDLNDDPEERERIVVGFRAVTVFDISQTDGKPLPDVGPRLLTGDGDAHVLEAAISLIESAGYSYSLDELRGPNGVTRPADKRVIVDPNLDGPWSRRLGDRPHHLRATHHRLDQPARGHGGCRLHRQGALPRDAQAGRGDLS